MEREDIITLLDEEGEEHNFVFLDIFSMNRKEYAIIVPFSDEASYEEEALLILRVDDDNGEKVLVVIEDEDEWEKAALEWESYAPES